MSLREFLEMMESKREVLHITDQVSPCFEISAVLQAFAHEPILLFENAEGFDTHVVGNICGTRKRLCSALGVDQENLYYKMIDAWRSPKPPKVVEDAPVKEVTESLNLLRIPVLTHFEKDAGAYITSGVVSARSPDGTIENVSVHRLLVLDETHLAIRLVPRHLFALWKMAKEEKRDLDVAIAIGVHPAVLLAAASSPPFGVSEYGIANVLLDGNLRLVKCESIDAYIPADAELVLEGRISCEKERDEGPLVDIIGTYDIQRKQPIIEVVNIMRRENYIYQAILPGGPEHRLLMGMPKEMMIYEAVSKVVPRVKAVNLTEGGCGWLHAVVSIEKQTDGDAKNALLATFAAHSSLKHAIVVDTDIDIYNPSDVEWAFATRFQGDEDLIIIRNARGSTLDPSADQEGGLTTKMGLDATKPLSKPCEAFEKANLIESQRVKSILERYGKRTRSRL